MNNTFKKRIDELGRIVIPKQIRIALKFKPYEELEMYIDKDSVIMKKSIGLEGFKDKLDNLLLLLKDLYKVKILISENNKIISSNSDDFLSGERLIINYDNLSKETNFISINLKENLMQKIYVDSLIYDSNLLGYIVFINDKNEDIDTNNLKKIKNTIFDLIN